MNNSLDQSSASIKKGSKSFSLAALFLPKAARPQVYALYSWCRACDDAVDAGNNQPNLKAIKAWAMDDPLIRSLIANQLCSEKYFDEMLCGMQMDLDHRGYQTLEELEVYGFRVAGVVGLMMCPVIGVQDPKALDHAIALGIAMQLTNICRDIFEDANRGRVYLPLSELGYKNFGSCRRTLLTWKKRASLHSLSGLFCNRFSGSDLPTYWASPSKGGKQKSAFCVSQQNSCAVASEIIGYSGCPLLDDTVSTKTATLPTGYFSEVV